MLKILLNVDRRYTCSRSRWPNFTITHCLGVVHCRVIKVNWCCIFHFPRPYYHASIRNKMQFTFLHEFNNYITSITSYFLRNFWARIHIISQQHIVRTFRVKLRPYHCISGVLFTFRKQHESDLTILYMQKDFHGSLVDISQVLSHLKNIPRLLMASKFLFNV